MRRILEFLLIFFLTGCSSEFGYLYVPGPQGIPGVDGKDGQPGVPGTDGDDSETEVVQLCGSCIAQYPSVFPEVGICFDGKLYGVYSVNGGFLVEIKPGSYSSNGVSCSCTFVVSEDCKVDYSL